MGKAGGMYKRDEDFQKASITNREAQEGRARGSERTKSLQGSRAIGPETRLDTRLRSQEDFWEPTMKSKDST